MIAAAKVFQITYLAKVFVLVRGEKRGYISKRRVKLRNILFSVWLANSNTKVLQHPVIKATYSRHELRQDIINPIIRIIKRAFNIIRIPLHP